jgi:hypothetical protein
VRLLLALLATGCGGSAEVPSVGKTYRLAYTHNVDGEIEPCG